MRTSPPRPRSKFPKFGQLLRAAAVALRASLPRSLERAAIDWTAARTRRRVLEQLLEDLSLHAEVPSRPAGETARELRGAIEALARSWDDIRTSLGETRVAGSAAEVTDVLAGRFLLLDIAVRAGAWLALTRRQPFERDVVAAYAEGKGFPEWLRRRCRRQGLRPATLAIRAKASRKTVDGWLATSGRTLRLPRTAHAKDLAAALAGDCTAEAAWWDTRFALAFADCFERIAALASPVVAATWCVGFAWMANLVREHLERTGADPWPVVLEGAHSDAPAVSSALRGAMLRARTLPQAYALVAVQEDWTLATSNLLRGVAAPNSPRRLRVILEEHTLQEWLEWVGLWFEPPGAPMARPPRAAELVPLQLALIQHVARSDPDKLREAGMAIGVDALVAIAERLRGDPAAAASAAERARAKDPLDLKAASLLADAELELGHPEAALRALAQLPRDDAPTWRRRGQALLMLGRFASALEALRRAEALAPDDPRIIRLLAEALKTRNPREAARYRRRVAGWQACGRAPPRG